MDHIRSLTLNMQQEQSFVKKIKERITDHLNVEADFKKLKAQTVDFSVLNNDSIQTMENTIGQQLVVPIKNAEGLDGEVRYTEVNGAWLSNVASKTRDEASLKVWRYVVNSDESFKRLSNYLSEEGYTLKTEEEYLMQDYRYLEDAKGEKLTKSLNVFTTPIYQDETPVGILVIDDDLFTPIISIGEERTFIHEEDGLVTVQAETCNLKWTKCMGECLPICSNWPSCLIAYGSCITACCGCANVVACIYCGVCIGVATYCLWNCRMCVSNAARPKECPVK
ncbi:MULTISPECIES: hypothetical protein [Rummeliibacillus]|uniref:hypothetical protein n=1 Tax=Rummeliibacillus TaxID=648802 RepID=UPI0011B6B6E9|nr:MULTISPECIES: hypothetical protein [Rummeliibacillus]